METMTTQKAGERGLKASRAGSGVDVGSVVDCGLEGGRPSVEVDCRGIDSIVEDFGVGDIVIVCR
jgi:hypothetical protein